ncbi:MAG: GNAT family N-acetyltransferase [Propionibacteriaceae bacterium]|jgi:GNAT superfamily N-acetyltransferase|nr:GNAT family N-acetyltransferase [Propionibacteriaceae bacterium]
MKARELDGRDQKRILAICRKDPVKSVFLASRVETGILVNGGVGKVFGWPYRQPNSFLHVGTNLAPLSLTGECIPAFVEAVGRRRVSQSIVGESWLVLPFWQELSKRYGLEFSQIREVRAEQPLMALFNEPRVVFNPNVRRMDWRDFPSYYLASKAMYSEEVGTVPPGDSYLSYCRWMVGTGRAFGLVQDGQVVFKADLGSSSGGVGQIQGVWLHPKLRGQGLSAPALAGACRIIQLEYPTISLYVNSFNIRALRLYQALGFTQIGEFATILY